MARAAFNCLVAAAIASVVWVGAMIVSTALDQMATLQPLSTWSVPRHPLPARHVSSVTDDSTDETASSSVSTARINRVFNLSALSDRQQRWARSILGGSCNYDWSKLVPALGGRKVSVKLGSPAGPGMFYPGRLQIQVHRYVYQQNRAQAALVLAWESAHAVDLLAMTPDDRAQVEGLYHDGNSDGHAWLEGQYDEEVGEAFMEGFVAAFCPSISQDPTFVHVTTPEVADGIRALL